MCNTIAGLASQKLLFGSPVSTVAATLVIECVQTNFNRIKIGISCIVVACAVNYSGASLRDPVLTNKACTAHQARTRTERRQGCRPWSNQRGPAPLQ